MRSRELADGLESAEPLRLGSGFGDALYGTMRKGGMYEQVAVYRYVPPSVQ